MWFSGANSGRNYAPTCRRSFPKYWNSIVAGHHHGRYFEERPWHPELRYPDARPDRVWRLDPCRLYADSGQEPPSLSRTADYQRVRYAQTRDRRGEDIR